MGDAYACGLGVEQDNEQAAAAYQKGAEIADMMSSIQLGHMYASECTAPPSDDAVHQAYQRAADEGYPEAHIGLRQTYLDGRGVAPIPYQAYLGAVGRAPAASGRAPRPWHATARSSLESLSALEISDADKFVKSLIATGSEPMNK